VVISQGKQVMQGDLKVILERKGTIIPFRIQVSGSTNDFAKVLKENNYEISDVSPSEITCMINTTEDELYMRIFKLAKENNMNIRQLTGQRLTLEDVFLDVVDTTL